MVDGAGDAAVAPRTMLGAGVMHARTSTFLTDPSRLDAGIAYVRDEVTAVLEPEPDFTGLSLIVNRDTGRFIIAAGWRDQGAMRSSEAVVAPLRARGAEILGAAPVVDEWEIAVVHRTHDTVPGACLRAVWTRIDVARLDTGIENYRLTLLPMMEELPGFCSASLFVDRATGRSVSSVTFDSRAEMEAGRPQAASIRRTAVQENDVQVLEVAEFEVALARLRAPESV